MKIVSRYKSIFGKGFTYEDGPVETLHRVKYHKNEKVYFEFANSNTYIGIDSMRVIDTRTAETIDTIDAELADLNHQARTLRKQRRDLIEKRYSKMKKVYKWDLEDIT